MAVLSPQLSDDCFHISCSVDILSLETITVGIDINACADPLNINVFVNESDIGLAWSHQFSGSESIPVPDLAIDIPDLGSAGVFLNVKLSGTSQDLSLSLGVDACVSVLGVSKCEPNPPYTLIEGTFNFVHSCAMRAKALALAKARALPAPVSV